MQYFAAAAAPIEPRHNSPPPPLMDFYDEFESSSSSSGGDHSSSSVKSSPSDSGHYQQRLMANGLTNGSDWSQTNVYDNHALAWNCAHEATPPPQSQSSSSAQAQIDEYDQANAGSSLDSRDSNGTRLVDVELDPIYGSRKLVDNNANADYWSTAPSTSTVQSPVTPSSASVYNHSHEPARRKQLEDQMEVEFEQVVHGHECGPSTIASPVAPSSAQPTYSTTSEPTTASSSRYPMSMPVDLSAVNAGIAPQLMGGLPSPPLDNSQKMKSEAPTVEDETMEDELESEDEPLQKKAVKASTKKKQTSTARSSRRNSIEPEAAPSGPHSRKPSLANGSSSNQNGPSLNLVTKDPVIASTIITKSVKESDQKRLTSAAGMGDVQLLVLGVPTVGAKSRVETQIKISLVLVREKGYKKASSSGLKGEKYLTPDGSLSQDAGEAYERIDNWTHVRLPQVLALKKKNSAKKTVKPAVPDPLPQDTLSLEVTVTRGSEPHEDVTICTGCQQREMKRAQRKKANKTASPHDGDLVFDPEEEKQKVVVFNCGEFVDFQGGETIIPTRITCYCRHHKERKGFAVLFKLKDSNGNTVAMGQTPPIMITDDHKTSAAAARPSHSADVSLDLASTEDSTSAMPAYSTSGAQLNASSAAPSVASSSKSSLTKKNKTKKKKDDKVSNVISAAASALRGKGKPTKRSTNRSKAARGSLGSDDEAPSSSAATTNGGYSSVNLSRSSSRSEGASGKKAKPYDSDQRPRKRPSGGSHRSPSFAMTPLIVPSPPLRPVPDASIASVPSSADSPLPAPAPPAQIEQWESALGLVGGMGMATDMLMNNPTVLRNNSISTDASGTAPSPARSSSTHFEWQSAANSPHLSPRSATTSVDDSFQSFFNSLSPPAPTTTATSPGALSAASSRSSRHDAQAAAARLHLQQQQQQHFQQQQQHTSLFTSSSGLATPSFSNGVGSASGLLQASTSNVTTPSATNQTNNIDWTVLQSQLRASALPAAPLPRISRLIPGEGPIHGGIEVTVLGDNFVPNLTCVFGDHAAVPTHYWSANTLVCVLPPSANPGPVVVGIKGVPLTVDQGTGLQLFTYKDDSDRSLLELALQVVGLKMTGRLEDASAVAMRIVGNGNGGNAGSAHASRNASPSANGGPMDAAALAMSLEAAASSVYSIPGTSRSSSRAHSRRASSASQSGTSSPVPSSAPLPYSTAGETRNFEGIVIKFLSLLDLDPSLIPGSAPSLPLERSPISHANTQGHTLLHLATVLGFHRLAQFLVARQIDVDARDRNGYTALHFAALYGRVAITRHLIDSGATTEIRNLAGKIALDIAQDRDDVDVEDILSRHRPATMYMPRASYPAFSPRSRYVQQLPSPSSSSHDTRELYSDEQEGDFEDNSEDSSFDESASNSDEWDSNESESDSSEEEEDSDDESGEDDVEEMIAQAHERQSSRNVSRNASMVSLHYLLEAEEDVKAEAEWDEIPLAIPAHIEEFIPSPAVIEAKAVASTATGWLFSRKKKPTMVLDNKNAAITSALNEKLQAYSTGGVVTDIWEKAKANAMHLAPLQHMPETLTAFPGMAMASMPFFLGGKSEVSNPPRIVDDSDADSDATTTERTVAMERAANAQGGAKDWSAWFHMKSPSSPPPVYSPTDRLLAPISPLSKSDKVLPPLLVSSPSSSSLSSAMSGTSISGSNTPRSSLSLRAGESGRFRADKMVNPRQRGVHQDRMLWLFWIPVLITVVSFGLYANLAYLRPAFEQIAELVLPRQIVQA